MKMRFPSIILISAIMAGILSSCITPNTLDIVAFCDHINVSYVDDGDGLLALISVETESGHQAGTYFLEAPPAGSPYPVSFAVMLDKNYPDGTTFNVYAQTSPSGTPEKIGADTCAKNGHHITHGPTWFEPGDSRLNRQAYAYAAIYCDDINHRVAIYGIHSQATDGEAPGKGFPAIFVPYDSLPATPTGANVLIQQYQNIGFYRLTTGEYQVNAGPDDEGKTYVVTFDGCPSSIMHAYIMENGVMTQTEVYPHQ